MAEAGSTIHGYRLLRNFTEAGGGQCRWTFARRGGTEYFLKEFLSPKFPTPGSPGSEKTKREKRTRCAAFEKHHRTLQTILEDKCAAGGNLVRTVEFFREGASYYKVTEKVDTSSMPFSDIATLEFDQRLLVIRTILHSVRILHREGIVHGDLKPDNLLIRRTPNGTYVAKVIDFDDSYFSGKPPADESRFVGDQIYFSPEAQRYLQLLQFQSGARDTRPSDVRPQDLTVASDVFALGLIFCQLLTGELPSFDRRRYHYPCVALNHGANLELPRRGIPSDLRSMLEAMISRSISARPSVDEIFAATRIGAPRRTDRAGVTGDLEMTSRGLRGSLLAPKARSDETEREPDAAPGASSGRLCGDLIRNRGARRDGA